MHYCAASDPRYVQCLAKNLNNQACRLIDQGNFDAAINNLMQALELTKNRLATKNDENQACQQKCCDIEFQPDDHVHIDDDCTSQDRTQSVSKASTRKRSVSSIIEIDADADEDDCVNDDNGLKTRTTIENENLGFVYGRPFRVNQRGINDCDDMGATISFIILFNIALAHHLKAIETVPLLVDTKEKMEVLLQPLKLYELAYQLHFQMSEEETDSANRNRHNGLVNIRLMLLITNNISEIHKLAGNIVKYKQCLDHMLSALMYMAHSFQNESVLSPIEKDGIFHNLAPILRTKVNAAAA